MSVSVVIATQNVAGVIGQCLDSLLPYYEQGYISEIIVVDGQSTDQTRDILKEYPVKLIIDEHRIPYNPSFVRNIGWRAAKSELIMFIDADAYLGEAFFPRAADMFSDKMVGIVGCRQLPIIENRVMKTTGEWWDYQTHYTREIHVKPDNLIHRMYCKALGFSSESIVVVGACYIVRKKCLEQVGGFDEQGDCADMPLSLAIVKSGYRARWYFDAPCYHRPRDSVKGLCTQRYYWGKNDCFHILNSSESWYNKLLPALIRLGTPILGLRLAIRYRNPWHLLLFPLAHYAWIVGYLTTLVKGGRV